MRGFGDVVKTYDRDIPGDIKPLFMDGSHRAQGNGIAAGKNR